MGVIHPTINTKLLTEVIEGSIIIVTFIKICQLGIFSGFKSHKSVNCVSGRKFSCYTISQGDECVKVILKDIESQVAFTHFLLYFAHVSS